MPELNGTSMLMRIFTGEAAKHQGKPLYQLLVEMLKQEKLAGVTVTRGIMGFGAKSHLHTTHILRLSQDLPIIVEVIDTQENIDRILPQVKRVMSSGLITVEEVKVLWYGAEAT